jgi:hypothetical protein
MKLKVDKRAKTKIPVHGITKIQFYLTETYVFLNKDQTMIGI